MLDPAMQQALLRLMYEEYMKNSGVAYNSSQPRDLGLAAATKKKHKSGGKKSPSGYPEYDTDPGFSVEKQLRKYRHNYPEYDTDPGFSVEKQLRKYRHNYPEYDTDPGFSVEKQLNKHHHDPGHGSNKHHHDPGHGFNRGHATHPPFETLPFFPAEHKGEPAGRTLPLIYPPERHPKGNPALPHWPPEKPPEGKPTFELY
jgi:hypothetical protein